MNCAQCSEELLDGDAFCTQCGAPAADSVAAGSESVLVADDANVEGSDGSEPIAEGDDDRAVRSSTEHAEGLAEPPTEDGPPREGAAGEACPTCGELLEPGVPYCTGCGESVESESVPHAEEPVVAGGQIEATDLPAEPPEVESTSEVSASGNLAAAAATEATAEGHVAGTGLDANLCSACGEPLEHDAALCTGCGQRTASPVENAAEVEGAESQSEVDTAQGPPCVSCGAPLEVGAAFCIECGARHAAAGDIAAAAPVEDSGADKPVADITQPAPDHVHCASCDQLLLSGASFCTSCGATTNLAQPPIQETAAGAFCIMCGHTIAGGVVFCTNCGARQGEDAAPAAPPIGPGSSETCHTCGESLEFGSVFCTNCGSFLEGEPEPIVVRSDDSATSTESAPTTAIAEHDAGSTLGEGPAGQTSFCIGCGHRLEPHDEFCIECGLPRGGVPDEAAATAVGPAQAPELATTDIAPTGEPVPAEESKRRRWLLSLWVVLGVGILVIGAWFGWRWLSSDEGGDQTAVAQEQGPVDEAAGQSPQATLSEQPAADTTAPAGESCQAVANLARDATVGLIEAFSPTDLSQLVGLARIGRQSLPGAGEFDATNTSTFEASTSSDCTAADAEVLFAAAMAQVPAPTAIPASIVYSAGTVAFGFDGADVLTRVGAALRLYPVHDGVVVTATPGGDLPRWTAILESLEVGDFTQADALAHAAAYSDRNITAEVLLSSDYGSLNPGYWVVYTGMFEDRNDATVLCSSVRSLVDFCYDRYVQHLPTTNGANGACGPYGRHNVAGIASGDVLDVHGGPSTGHQVLGTYSRNQTAILAAGLPISAGSTSWTPLVINGKIGWAQSRFLSVDSACAGTTPPSTSVTSCSAVAVATADLMQSIVVAAEAGDVSELSSATAIDITTFDDIAAQLVADAGANRCDVPELNNLVTAQHGGITASGPFASLVRDILVGQLFFREG